MKIKEAEEKKERDELKKQEKAEHET